MSLRNFTYNASTHAFTKRRLEEISGSLHKIRPFYIFCRKFDKNPIFHWKFLVYRIEQRKNGYLKKSYLDSLQANSFVLASKVCSFWSCRCNISSELKEAKMKELWCQINWITKILPCLSFVAIFVLEIFVVILLEFFIFEQMPLI